MAEFIVTSESGELSDPEDNARLTLQQALEEARLTPEEDTITFAPDVKQIEMLNTYQFAAVRIEHDLSNPFFPNLKLIEIEKITIDGDHNGDGQPDVTVSMPDHGNRGHHFTVDPDAEVELKGLTLENGYGGSTIAGADSTSSIINQGTLTLTDVDFVGNEAYGNTGVIGRTGNNGVTPSKAPDGAFGLHGRPGQPGGPGGKGGEAATITNDGGELVLNNVRFDENNVLLPGNGGRGGKGGNGSNGGEGGDAAFGKTSKPGGDGGWGGIGGVQGLHGRGAEILNKRGTVEGFMVANTKVQYIKSDDGLRTAFGGEGGDGGLGGKSIIGRADSGEKGDDARNRQSPDIDLRVDPAIGHGTDLTVVDAYFTAYIPNPTNTEGDTVSIVIQRHAMDDNRGAYEVEWRLDLNPFVTTEDFVGAFSGKATFSELSDSNPGKGLDIDIVEVKIAKDQLIEGIESVRVVLSNPTYLGSETRTTAVDPEGAVFTIASEIPSDGDDDLSGTAAPNTYLMREGDDTIRGLGGEDILKGQGGDDALFGGGQADLLIGGQGDDILRGGVGQDTLRGDAGSDRLIGGNGADRLIAGKGEDTVKGGRDADTFVFENRPGKIIVLDYEDGEDKLDVVGATRMGDLEISQDRFGTKIVFEDTIIRLRDVFRDELTADDFLF